jgi:hypothetical protein
MHRTDRLIVSDFRIVLSAFIFIPLWKCHNHLKIARLIMVCSLITICSGILRPEYCRILQQDSGRHLLFF